MRSFKSLVKITSDDSTCANSSKSIAIGHETRRVGKLYGMFGGRFQLCTRKFSEQAFEPCRNPLPTDLQLIDEAGCPLTIQDNRGEDHGGLSISVLTRLHANREDLLAHRFPKIVLRNLKQSIEESLHADDSDNDKLITALAFEELNVHVGFSDDGKYKHEYERTNGDTTLYFIPRVAAAFKAAYVEYFDDAIQEESWRTFQDTREQLHRGRKRGNARTIFAGILSTTNNEQCDDTVNFATKKQNRVDSTSVNKCAAIPTS